MLFFILFSQEMNGQKIELKTITIDTINNSFLKSIKFKNHHDSKESIFIELNSISLKLSKIGFLENEIHSTNKTDSLLTVYFFLGVNSNSIKIDFTKLEINPILLNDLNIDIAQGQVNTPINEVPKLLNDIVSILEKNGSSFAQVSLKNITKTKNGLTADLNIQSTAERTIDHIIVKEYESFPKSFIKHYLNLKIGTTFNTEKLNDASLAIQSLSFASKIKNSEILFTPDSTTVYLYLQKRKNNTFDGLIGFFTDESGKLKFNGYLDLQLNNLLNKGESLSIYWKGNGEERKVFNLEVNTPFIFGSPISPKVNFNIYKQDSTFLNVKVTIDLAYLINSKNSLSAKFQSESSNDLTESLQNTSIEEYKNTFYGLSYTNRQLDLYRPFQNKFYFSLNALWGSRTITSRSEKENQEKYELHLYYNWSLNQKNTLFIQSTSAVLFSNNLFTNELYRIGGANSIRGFNEEAIFSSAFSVLNLEYQYNINQTSYLYTITDYAYVQNSIENINTNLYGFGLGYTYGTKSGVIDISYALGKQDDISFNFNNSKFHIKLTQYF